MNKKICQAQFDFDMGIRHDQITAAFYSLMNGLLMDIDKQWRKFDSYLLLVAIRQVACAKP